MTNGRRGPHGLRRAASPSFLSVSLIPGPAAKASQGGAPRAVGLRSPRPRRGCPGGTARSPVLLAFLPPPPPRGQFHSTGSPSLPGRRPHQATYRVPSTVLGVPSSAASFLSSASPRLPPLNFSFRVSGGKTWVFSAHGPGMGGSVPGAILPCVGREGTNWWRLRAGGARGKQRGQEVPPRPKEGGPARAPSPPHCLVSPVCSQFTSGLFRFLGLFFARQCGSHPPPRSAALGGVRAGCEQKRAKCELIDHAREPPLPPRVPPPFPVYNV